MWSPWLTSFRRFKWAMRVVALIEFLMLTIANLVSILMPTSAGVR